MGKEKPWIIVILNKDIFDNRGYGFSSRILFDRLEEFDVISDNKIDYISLSSLYNFYNLDFNEERFKKHFNYHVGRAKILESKRISNN